MAEVDASVVRLVDDMFETMYAAPGIGLAMIQVNVPVRVITIDVSEAKNEPLALINPEIVTEDGELETEEGCLSVLIYESVKRAESIRVRALGRDGEQFEMAEGISRCASSTRSTNSMASSSSTTCRSSSASASARRPPSSSAVS